MMKKNKGQEAIEFALIAVLVFFVSVFTVLVLGDKLSDFFNSANNPLKKGETASTKTSDLGSSNTSFSATPTTSVSVNIGNGQQATINIPDTSFYTNSTTGAAGMLDAIQNGSDLSNVLSQAIKDLAGATNNSNLQDLSNLMASTAALETGFLNYDSTNGADWISKIDPNSPTFGDDLTAALSSLPTTLRQIQSESSTAGSWNNSITGVQQDDFAAKLQQTLTSVNNDATLTPDTKAVATLLTQQVQTIADNNTYTIDTDAFNTAASAFTTIGLNSTAFTSSLSQTNNYNTVIATAVIDIFCNNPNVIDEINQLPLDEKQKMMAALQTLHIEVKQPPDAVINTNLAAQTSCVAGGGQWDNGLGKCS